MTEESIDIATLRALQESAGEDFVAELARAFLEEAPKMVAALRASVNAGDENAFRRNAHSLKSNSLTFGALPLAALARALELSASEAIRGCDAALDTLDAERRRVDAALRELARA